MALQERVRPRIKETIGPEIDTVRPSARPASAVNILQKTDTVLSDIDLVLGPTRIKAPRVVDMDEESAQIRALHDQWDSALGEQPDEGKIANYHPVLARWNFERAQTPEQVEIFRQNELKNIETALRERNRTSESRLRLTFDESGLVQNDMKPDELYQDLLMRGVRYRAENGSQETEREQAEVKGFLKIQSVLSNPETPIGKTFFVVSPPSSVEDSPYKENFVDFYKAAEDPETGKRYIDYVRFASPLGYENYHSIAEDIQPDYFDGEVGSIDAWYLGNPLSLPDEHTTIDDVFSRYFKKDVEAMKEQEFQELWNMYYFPVGLYLIDQITKEDFGPVETAKIWNTLLASPENKKMKAQVKETVLYVAPNAKTLNGEDSQRIGSWVRQFGQETIEDVVVGCGTSGGFKIAGLGGSGGGDEPWSGTYAGKSNSAALFGTRSSTEVMEWFNCPKCAFKADGPVGDSCPGCRLTKDEFAESGGEVC